MTLSDYLISLIISYYNVLEWNIKGFNLLTRLNPFYLYMRKKTIFIHNGIKYPVKEPTVWLYRTFLVDVEQFLEELFLEFNDNVPKLDKDQSEELLKELFDIKTEDLDKLFKKITNKDCTDKKIEDFHVLIWKYWKFFSWENYISIMQIPMTIFNKMLSDLKIFSWEQEYDKNRHSKNPDKKWVKELFNKQ